MRAALLIFALLVVAVPTQASSAELYLQGRIERTCGPATPTGIVVHHWKSTCPSDDCFSWRLSCSNGARHELHSAEHPGTTVLEHTFYAWAPWSLALCMVPFLLYSGLALLGAERRVLVAAINVAFLGYFLAAGAALYVSIIGNPWGNWSEAQRIAFLNPYAFGGILVAFLLINLAAVCRGVEFLFFAHTPHPAYGALMVLADPFQANRAGGSFMPNLYELIDPIQTAEHYRRETELLNAQRDKLDAQRSFAESYLRARRALNASSEEGE